MQPHYPKQKAHLTRAQSASRTLQDVGQNLLKTTGNAVRKALIKLIHIIRKKESKVRRQYHDFAFQAQKKKDCQGNYEDPDSAVNSALSISSSSSSSESESESMPALEPERIHSSVSKSSSRILNAEYQDNKPLAQSSITIKTVTSHMGLAAELQRINEIQNLNSIAKGNWKENLQMAELAREHVRSMLRNGSNAALDPHLTVEEAVLLSRRVREEFANRLCDILLDCGRKRYGKNGRAWFVPWSETAKISTRLLEEFGFGQCEEQAEAAYHFLRQRGVQAEICETAHHFLLVIGRKPGSDLEDTKTWGDDAVICDPWANRVYPLYRFEEMQAPQNNVKFLYADDPEIMSAHYLAGSLICRPSEREIA